MLLIKEASRVFYILLFMSYRYLLSLLLFVAHKSVPKNNELAEERNEPGKLP